MISQPEGRPLLTVETEPNGDSKSTYQGGPSLVGSLGSSRRYKRFLSCTGCYIRPDNRFCVLTVQYVFHFICPHRSASKLDRLSCRDAWLLMCVSVLNCAVWVSFNAYNWKGIIKKTTNILRKRIARPQSQFPHSWVCERFIYYYRWSAYSAAGNIFQHICGPILGIYTDNSSQTHECGMWKLGLRRRNSQKRNT